MPTSTSREIDRRSLGPYEIIGELSKGGMGQVLLARRRGAHGFEKLVAIKTLRPDLGDQPKFRAMFLDEARLVARLQHPAIAQVHDFGEQEDVLYLAMEYIAGVSFEALRARKPAAAIVALAIAEACRGLHAAHETTDAEGRSLGVVHRDVSPQNLMLTFDGRVKVLDFGIAVVRNRQTPTTELGQIKGKPAYMAPEQLRGERIDRRVDVFAAGVVLYELLTGGRLFTGDSMYAIVRAIEQQAIPAPSTRVAGIPPGIDEIALRALARDPARRYATALSMAEALERVALAADSERLETYARRELEADRVEDAARLERLLDGPEAPAVRRAGDLATIPLGPPGAGPVGAEPPKSRPERTPSTAPSSRVRSSARLVLLALVLLFAFGIGLRILREDPAAAPQGDLAESAHHPGAVAGGQPASLAEPGLEAPNLEPANTPASTKPLAPRAKRRASSKDHVTLEVGDPTVEPKTFGYLTVGAQPYALVLIDGQEVGATPLVRQKVPTGRHVIALLSPDSRSLRLRREVDVTTEEEVSVVLK